MTTAIKYKHEAVHDTNPAHHELIWCAVHNLTQVRFCGPPQIDSLLVVQFPVAHTNPVELHPQQSTLMTKRELPDGDAAAPASASASAQPAKQHKKHKKHKKIPKQQRVGNFRSYYTYRLGQKHQGELEDDPRLAALDKFWFEGKRGLDIGCNSGELTIAIAKRLAPSYLLGVDVDPQLVSRARGHLKDILRQEQIEKAFGEIPAVKTTSKSGGAATSAGPEDAESPANVGEAARDGVEKERAKDEEKNDTKTGDGDAFANDMPLSFRLWKPSMQTQAAMPKAIGKAAVSSRFPLNVIFKREDVVSDAHAGKDYDFITW
ncbi:unnamed protein product [Phytophthora fragariaefolia]|uniref:RNA methyltransferase n=1 Tax=Phytophthora fragariaefolia TaxID=1490495 RepID=A0A9W6U1V7_9STRA|nr:unnamed protein product [Phytophthora fragariaefolia]